MNMPTTTTQTASAKGQVTIPVAIRRKLGIEPGSTVRFVERDGVVVLEKVDRQVSSLFGLLKAERGATLEQMKEAVVEEAAARFDRR
jgi:AbrB family looped-hinge helix DNA binding protein